MDLNDYVVAYWLEHYIDEVTYTCLLCQRTGIIDTSASTVKDAWKRKEKVFPCICPDGQALRKAQQEVEA